MDSMRQSQNYIIPDSEPIQKPDKHVFTPDNRTFIDATTRERTAVDDYEPHLIQATSESSN